MNAEYQLLEPLYESERSHVHRALRETDQAPVVLKFLRDEAPSAERLAWFQREFEVTQSLDIPGVIRAQRLFQWGHQWAMELEDFGGHSLEQLGVAGELGLEDFLTLALALADIVAQVHQRQIIHKDLNPSNIVMRPDTGQVKLIDFGISAVLSSERPSFRSPHVLEGTLAYISPEQTGRINRAVDSRSDLYSLGVTLYKLLCGVLPFPEADPLQLVHAHLARAPTPPIEHEAWLPPLLSDMVLKLMAKNAEQRYQSAAGLRADLLRLQGGEESFPLGQSDVFDRLRQPQQLYGRGSELEQLTEAFHSARRGRAQAVLVAGYSGVGKSALVHELHRPLTEHQGLFLAGKFDQHQRGIPHTALLQMLRGLMEQLLTLGEEGLAEWRQRALAAVGPNAQVLIEVVPELGLLLGPQPAPPQLGASEAENRFHLTVQRFLQAFARPEHPLILFWDDLQWADRPSLKLLERLLLRMRHGLLLGAYRDNEVQATHPLAQTLDALQQAEAPLQVLALGELQQPQVAALLADVLHREGPEIDELAQLLYGKSGGNPFFLMELLRTLHGEGLLSYLYPEAGSKGGWRWDEAELRARDISDNVVALLLSKTRQLPSDTGDALALCACLGNHFQLSSLALVSQRPHAQMAAALWPALDAGLVVPLHENYKLYASHQARHDDPQPLEFEVHYKFAHDRVQQAAYGLWSEAKLPEVHLRIGRRLRDSWAPQRREERLFALVGHLNLGRELLRDPGERLELLQMDLRAAQRARDAAAYGPALAYLDVAQELLPEDAWQTQPKLALGLHTAAAELSYLNGDLERMQGHIEQVLERATTALEKVPAQEIQIQAHLTQAEFGQAVDTMLDALRPLGVRFPKEPGPEDIGAALEQTLAPWLSGDLQPVLELPEMEDPTQQAIIRLLTRANPAAYLSRPALLPLMVCEQVRRSVAHGNAPSSPFAYSFFAILLCGVTGQVVLGDAFSQLSLQLAERPQSRRYKCRSLYIDCTFVGHWLRPLRQVLSPLSEVFQLALEVGDLEFVGYAAFMHSNLRFWAGEALAEVAKQADAYHQAICEHQQETARNYNGLLRTAIGLLRREEPPQSLEFRGEGGESEEAWLAALEAANDRYGIFNLHLFKLQLLVHLDRPHEALDHARRGEPYFDAAVANVTIPFFVFYAALAALATVDPKQGPDAGLLASVEGSLASLKGWAQGSTNFEHCWHLVEAERLRVLGRRAQEHYEQAIAGAQERGFGAHEALAAERAAAYYRHKGQTRLFRHTLKDAHAAYLRWGATARASQLQAQHPELLRRPDGKTSSLSAYSTLSSTVSSNRASEVLDLASVLKASQSISSELRLEQLLQRLMDIVIENAGAQVGYLLRSVQGQWQIQAQGRLEQSHPQAEAPPELPASILNYVIHTRQSLLLDDALADGPFVQDPYIQSRQPKSILCLPLLSQGELSGIVYLENDLSTGAFPPERLQLLEMLSAQAAISLENASLVAHLEDKVAERTQELQDALEQLEQRYTQLKEAQTQLVQSEKMASLGTLVAGIAHELNNPANFVRGGERNLSRRIGELHRFLIELAGEEAEPEVLGLFEQKFAPLQENLASIAAGVERIEKIVAALRTFSRLDQTEQKKVQLVDGLQVALELLEAGYRPFVKCVTDFPEDPALECWPGELNQVFTQIIANACQAIRAKQQRRSDPTPGQLLVSTALVDQGLAIEFTDDGIGMAPEVQARVFEPFFTTKEVGQGAGLGLSIAFGIVEKHQGQIHIASTPGQGTTVRVVLPLEDEGL